MSSAYEVVIWNRNKLIYDAILAALIVAYIGLFLRFAPHGQSALDDATLHMRAYGSCAFLMLTAILCIGPLARLESRFLPLLYNRRHFGVMACAVALAHANAVLGWYFAFSPTDPYVALLSSNTSFARLAGFPFEILGMAALLILLVMAATSHDFWLHFLGAPVWKGIHMAVYAAYGLIVAHVMLGALQEPGRSPLQGVVIGSFLLVAGLHLLAAFHRKAGAASVASALPEAPWLHAGPARAIMDGRAIRVALPDGSSAAIFRDGNKLSAVSNACAHQNGPLSEGRIVKGSITCPWHGYQYRAKNGCSPPPFTEKIATYNLRLVDGNVWVDPRANPAGTSVEPLVELMGDAL